MTPATMLQYRQLGGRPGAMLFYVRKVEGGYKPVCELLEGATDEVALKAAIRRRDDLALDAEIERIIIGSVFQEMRRDPVERDGQVVLPFNLKRG